MTPLWVVRSRPVESGTKGLGLEFYLTNGIYEFDGFSYARVAINRAKATNKENRSVPLDKAITDAVERGEEAASILNQLEEVERGIRKAEMDQQRKQLASLFPGAVKIE